MYVNMQMISKKKSLLEFRGNPNTHLTQNNPTLQLHEKHPCTACT